MKKIVVFLQIPGVLLLLVSGWLHGAEPVLPQNFVDLPEYSVNSPIIYLPEGGDLQLAIDAAVPGDIIELQAGAVYRGPFVLPQKQGEGWIHIQTRDADMVLPRRGARVSPADARAMAVLVSAAGPVISSAPGASHYHFVGLELRPLGSGAEGGSRSSTQLTTLVDLSAADNTSGGFPHHIVFEQCYLRGDPQIGARRGVAMNGAYLAVVDSHLADFKSAGQDSQAIAGWDGPGPFLISNTYLEAAGEAVMFGGEDPVTRDLVPSDIVITGNHFSRPLSWQSGHSDHDGSDWTIKNLLELKNARRVLIDGNLFEHNWASSQSGFAVLFTVRNQYGQAPWSVVSDIRFTNNIVRHAGSGINILGRDDNHPSQTTNRLLIANNLFHDIGGDWGSGGLFQIINGAMNIVFRHNTSVQSGNIMTLEGEAMAGFEFSNNLVRHNQFGIIGTGTRPGNMTLETFFENPRFYRNVLIGADHRLYPFGTLTPASISNVNFRDQSGYDFRLPDVRDGDPKSAGVDFPALCAALSVTEKPAYCSQ